ncbi:unnamed protein product [Didymodactylos carnosus]|uniref:Uncharacterized protein n=1 Tax=Didymodactylos carnosus TaxID=1234261 RepID=A0A815J5J7_9BILA|nr:unnamed protein product [Didymodactylos carnosus]CAF1375973.1 unnamed protein product [Didymodactylos carnosus]CAF4035836.1 unnamed protein product [Didymodactylos carnosus]CAF4266380.1 unnamed protein product [Didymodactylos carnosus]
MMAMEQDQNEHQQSAPSLSDEDGNGNDDVLPKHVAELIRVDKASDMENLADDMERLGGNEQPPQQGKSSN